MSADELEVEFGPTTEFTFRHPEADMTEQERREHRANAIRAQRLRYTIRTVCIAVEDIDKAMENPK